LHINGVVFFPATVGDFRKNSGVTFKSLLFGSGGVSSRKPAWCFFDFPFLFSAPFYLFLSMPHFLLIFLIYSVT
jgi:hypothetical protein